MDVCPHPSVVQLYKGCKQSSENCHTRHYAKRKRYAKFTPEQQAAIGEYASLHSNQLAICHFTKQLGVELKVNSGQTWKGNYQAEISHKQKAGEMSDLACLEEWKTFAAW